MTRPAANSVTSPPPPMLPVTHPLWSHLPAGCSAQTHSHHRASAAPTQWPQRAPGMTPSLPVFRSLGKVSLAESLVPPTPLCLCPALCAFHGSDLSAEFSFASVYRLPSSWDARPSKAGTVCVCSQLNPGMSVHHGCSTRIC